MIVFDLSCPLGHRFEGWFGSSADFARQQDRGILTCPECGSADVAKAPMAPAVPRKANRRIELTRAATSKVANQPMPPQMREALQQLAKIQAEALKASTWVGAGFAEASRAMFYGERDEAPIHGEVSASEAQELMEEGVPVAPLLFPVAPPDELN
jgi:hypothetical protein